MPARFGLGVTALLWGGILIGVSFLAAPAKFMAPSLSLPVALDVGRQEFATLNLVEIALAVITLALAIVARPARGIWIALVVAWLVVALQALWLLPVLDARVELVLDGQTPPPAPWHTLYIVIEVIKLLAVLGAGLGALWPIRKAA
ncbi:MAG: hypothetical protein ACREH6_12060 [Geminicoccaceae bacterium]